MTRLICLAVFAVLCVRDASAGPQCTEPGGAGAGSLPGTAFACSGMGSLKTIAGDINSASVAGPEGDFEDMYLIRICDPTLFCVRTSAMFDTQVWLFRPVNQANPQMGALGLLGNNDSEDGTVTLTMFPPATDQTRQIIPAPGLYFVAISASPNVPLSGPPPSGLPIFQFANHTEISGPDGPGGTMPIGAWSAQVAPPPGGGLYMLELEGAALLDDTCLTGPYVEDPCTDVPAVSEWGLVVLTLLVLVSGAIVLRRVSPQSSTV